MKVTVIPIVIGALGTVTKRIVKGIGGNENKKTSGDHAIDCTVKIGQTTEKIPGDLKRLAVTQNPEKGPSADAGVKTCQRRKLFGLWKKVKKKQPKEKNYQIR